MKSVINIELVLLLIFVYFFIGDPLSLASLSSSFLGKSIVFLLLLIFSSYNVVYGLIFLVLMLQIDENNYGLNNLTSLMEGYEGIPESGIMKSLEIFKCNNGVSSKQNWEDQVVFINGAKCDPCNPKCKKGKHWEMKQPFKLVDNNDLLSLQEALSCKKSRPVVNNYSTEDVGGFNLK